MSRQRGPIVGLIVGGFLLQILASVLTTAAYASYSMGLMVVALMVALGGTVVWCWGCWRFASSKGYDGALGLVLGLVLGLIGLLILALLRDKSAQSYAGPMAMNHMTHGMPTYGMPAQQPHWSQLAQGVQMGQVPTSTSGGFCHGCGKQIDVAWRACPHCGTQFAVPGRVPS
ncbi:MAG: hypothetical protein GX604_08350 [Actinobacteria bacterium]|nr:hypothetical protein [Actinomycetota bacterium]